MQSDKNIFDNLTVYAVRWPCQQPDLRKVIRLFVDAIPAWFCRLFVQSKFLRIYYIRKRSALLGADYRNLEFRLYLIKCEEFPAHLIIILAGSYMNTAGFIKSLLMRPLLLLALSSTLKAMVRQPTFFGHTESGPAEVNGV